LTCRRDNRDFFTGARSVNLKVAGTLANIEVDLDIGAGVADGFPHTIALVGTEAAAAVVQRDPHPRGRCRLGMLTEDSYRHKAFLSKILPVQFDAFDLVQRFGGQIALTAVWTTHHRNILDDQQIFAFAVTAGYIPHLCPFDPTNITHHCIVCSSLIAIIVLSNPNLDKPEPKGFRRPFLARWARICVVRPYGIFPKETAMNKNLFNITQILRERGVRYVVDAKQQPTDVLLSLQEYEHYLELLEREAARPAEKDITDQLDQVYETTPSTLEPELLRMQLRSIDKVPQR
jgi:hypothetical protein